MPTRLSPDQRVLVTVAQHDGRTILLRAPQALEHALDLRFWVELRGFEPLAPSMRMWSCINQPCYPERRNLAAADPR